MRKARWLSLFAVGVLAASLICMIALPGGRAATLSPYEVLYSFEGGTIDGATPGSSLTLSGTTLYGMTYGGGVNGFGTIFMLDTATNVETVLYSFGAVKNDGEHPEGSPTLSGTTLYGTTNKGGANGNGTIFMFDTVTNVETVLYSFGEVTNDGANPYDGTLTLSGSTLYGMTQGGGANGKGTIFKFDTTKNAETVLYSFAGGKNDGAIPLGSLILSGTTLYGMTDSGGANGKGTIFKFDTTKNAEKVLYSFAGGTNDGEDPIGSLTLSGTTLYGMTGMGGANGNGTIFMFHTKTKVETVLYSFGSVTNDGAHPYDGALTLSGSTLYGMTQQGGANDVGTVFMFDTKTNVETVLYSFAGGTNDGAYPQGDLTLSGTTLYGMTSEGGPNGVGTVFSLPDVPLSSISGNVNALRVLMTLSQPAWTTTENVNSSGAYAFGDLTPGKYTVTPSEPGYVFTPKSASVIVNGNNLTENFTASAITISGTVTFNGEPVTADLNVNLSGKASGTYTSTGASGYIFGPLVNGSYKVTPVLTHPTPVPAATPASASIVINGKSVTKNFTYKSNDTCFAAGCHVK